MGRFRVHLPASGLLRLVFIFFGMNAFAQPTPAFDLQGHRGSRGLRPENTLAAFRKALELGVQTLELDVCVSADGQLVVSHEPYFNAAITTKPGGQPLTKAEEPQFLLYKMPYADIKAFDVGQRGNPAFPEQQKMPAVKPLLAEVIADADAYARKLRRPLPRYNVEIKSSEKDYGLRQPQVPEFSRLVLKTLLSQLPAERFNIQSFDFSVLKFLHDETAAKGGRKIRLAVLVSGLPPDSTVARLGFVPEVYSPSHVSLTYPQVQRAQALGMSVIPWTVNEPARMDTLRRWGVNGLITDYPDRFRP